MKTHIPLRPSLKLACTVLAAVAGIKGASAANYTWDGTTGLFSDNLNWSSDIVPGPADRGTIANSGTAQLQAGDNITVANLDLNNGNLTQSGGTFLSSSRMKLGNLTGTVNFTQTAGSLTTNERLYIADGNGSATILSNATASIGGTVSANDYLVVGRQGGNESLHRGRGHQ